MKCQALIDWLTFSVKSTKDPAEVIQKYLGMDPAVFQDPGYGLLGYNDYVDTLPFTGYDSAGSFLWYPSSSNLKDPKIHFATYTSSQHFYLSDCQNYTLLLSPGTARSHDKKLAVAKPAGRLCLTTPAHTSLIGSRLGPPFGPTCKKILPWLFETWAKIFWS